MSTELVLLAQRSSSGSAAGLGFFAVVMIAMLVFYVAIYVFYSWCTMRIFQRAGIKEWYAWVPFVNQYGLWKMTNREELWLILLFVPYANLIAQLVVFGDIARSFGKDQTYEWCLGLLSFIWLPMLAFDKSPFLGPSRTDLYPWTSRRQAWPAAPGGYPPPGPYGYGQPAPYGYGQPDPYAAPPYGQAPPAAAYPPPAAGWPPAEAPPGAGPAGSTAPDAPGPSTDADGPTTG